MRSVAEILIFVGARVNVGSGLQASKKSSLDLVGGGVRPTLVAAGDRSCVGILEPDQV